MLTCTLLSVALTAAAPSPDAGHTALMLRASAKAGSDASIVSLAQRRRAFKTAIHEKPTDPGPAEDPPPEIFEKVWYPAPLGKNVAYVTPVRKGPRRPAVVWIHGGEDWSIGDAWSPEPRENDQSARAFREAGLVLMLPSPRGCNDNPGEREFNLGEVDDFVAAIDFLAQRPDVDPARIYLGGHSTGATMALLVAARGAKIRGAFVFGPAARIEDHRFASKHGLVDAPLAEREIRSPVTFIDQIRVPTYVIEGKQSPSNWGAIPELQQAVKSAPVKFLALDAATHFTTLAPITELIAKKLSAEKPGDPPLSLSEAEVVAALEAK